jgi:hypothetical protein
VTSALITRVTPSSAKRSRPVADAELDDEVDEADCPAIEASVATRGNKERLLRISLRFMLIDFGNKQVNYKKGGLPFQSDIPYQQYCPNVIFFCNKMQKKCKIKSFYRKKIKCTHFRTHPLIRLPAF